MNSLKQLFGFLFFTTSAVLLILLTEIDYKYNLKYDFIQVFQYKDPTGKFTGNISFSQNWTSYLADFGLLPQNSGTWRRSYTLITPQFVSAYSDNHQSEMTYLYSSFDEYFKNDTGIKLIVYDLGLNNRSRKASLEKWGHRIEIREFHFENFPNNVKKLTSYRFKPLIVASCLKEFKACWWLDASSVFMKGRMNVSLQPILEFSMLNGVSSAHLTFHSLFSVTHPGMNDYFPLPTNQSQSLKQIGANRHLFYRTPETQRIVRFWVLCALEPYCIEPAGSERLPKGCTFKNQFMDRFANCHRYDQSALNMILALESGFNISKYLFPFDQQPITTVWRTA